MKLLKLDIQLFADGKVVIDTELNRKGFEAGLNKIQSVAEKGFKGIAASVGIVATAMTALVGKSVMAAGELEQQMGGAEAVFKNLGKSIDDIKFTSFKDAKGQLMSLRDVANDAYKNMGVSANDYLATINKMGALMQGSGIDAQTSMDLSGKAMQRTADIASIMGIDINTAMESIAGAAKGNFTMMDNLGVAMNATTIEAYALSKGIKKSYNEMTNSEKIQYAMQMFLEKTAYAEGNYAKENETFAGSFNTLKASIQNFLSGASDIEPVIKSIMSFSNILIKSITEMAPKIIDGIVKLINNIIPQLPKLLEQLLPVVIQGTIDLINGLVKSLPTIIPVLINGIIDAINSIVKILPQIGQPLIDGFLLIINEISKQLPVLIPLIVDIILKLVDTIINNIDLFIDAAIQLIVGLTEGLIKALPILIAKAPVLIGKLVEKLTAPDMIDKLIRTGAKLIAELVVGIINSIPKLLSGVSTIKDSLAKGFKNLKKSLSLENIGKNIVKGLWSGISGAGGWIKGKIGDWCNKLVAKFKEKLKIGSPSKVMRDEIGIFMAQGVGVGFEDELRSVYADMTKAIDFENAKMQSNVEMGKVFNTLNSATPINIELDANVEMDNQKVGRLVTPVVMQTINTKGVS